MAINMTGKTYCSEFTIKYGEKFPQEKRNKEMYIDKFGYVNIYILSLGKARWEKDLTVRIPVRFYITDIITPAKEQHKEEMGLRLIKGKQKSRISPAHLKRL